MPVYPIPDDWDGETWGCVLVEWPLSEQWFGLLRGLITTPVRGRFWDGSTGIITDAQSIGLDIEGRNPVVSCEDITAALLLINATLENLDVNSSTQLTILTDIDVNANLIATAVSQATIDQTVALVAVQIAQAKAEASAYAWSQAFSQNLTPITIINNTVAQFRPIEVGVDPPPQTAEEAPTQITSVAEDTSSTEICKRVYWLVRDLKEYLIYLDDLNNVAAYTVLGLSGLLSDALWFAAYKADPLSKRFLVPAAVFLSVAHQLQELLADGFDPWDDLRDWIENRYQDLVCNIALMVDIGESTGAIKQYFVDEMDGYGINPLFQFIPLVVFNFSSLAALYYVSPILDPAPAIPPYEPANICTFCGG